MQAGGEVLVVEALVLAVLGERLARVAPQQHLQACGGGDEGDDMQTADMYISGECMPALLEGCRTPTWLLVGHGSDVLYNHVIFK